MVDREGIQRSGRALFDWVSYAEFLLDDLQLNTPEIRQQIEICRRHVAGAVESAEAGQDSVSVRAEGVMASMAIGRLIELMDQLEQ